MKITDFFFDISKKCFIDEKYKGILCLDRDGVIIKEKNYLNNPDDIEFIEGSIEALKNILDENFFVAVISNQAGIAKGIISINDFNLINDRFMNMLKDRNVFIHCIVYCPYHPDGILSEFSKKSVYRKPSPGMYKLIEKYYHITSKNVFMIGDKLSDIEFGIKIGAKSIIVDTGYGSLERSKALIKYKNVLSFSDLSEAIKWIINHSKVS
jgi:D,D-heptose 1,7-bisphosphate phosphatase